MSKKNETNPLKQHAVSGSLHLPTKDEIIKTLYQCAKSEKTDEGVVMKRVFEKEAEAILSLITGNDR
jgi:hypothetical protein